RSRSCVRASLSTRRGSRTTTRCWPPGLEGRAPPPVRSPEGGCVRGLSVVLRLVAVCALGLGAAGFVPPTTPAPDKLLLETPAGERAARIDRAGETVLPIGRLLTPAGRQIDTAPHPFGMALSADGSVLVTVNGGVGPFSLTVVRDPASP